MCHGLKHVPYMYVGRTGAVLSVLDVGPSGPWFESRPGRRLLHDLEQVAFSQLHSYILCP